MKKVAIAGLTGLLLAAPANAATIFQQSLTGAGLLGDTNVEVFENPTLNGSRLDYTSRSVSRGALVRWDILGASSYNDLTVTVQLDYDALSAGDNDLFIGISDGTNVVAPTRIDAFSGAINIFDGTVGGTVANPSLALDGSGVSTVLTSLGGVDPITFSVQLPAAGSDATLQSVQEGAASASNISFDRALTPDNGLQLILFGDGVPERYGINSVSVTVDEAEDVIVAVPEPAPLVVLALGLIGLGWKRRKRRA